MRNSIHVLHTTLTTRTDLKGPSDGGSQPLRPISLGLIWLEHRELFSSCSHLPALGYVLLLCPVCPKTAKAARGYFCVISSSQNPQLRTFPTAQFGILPSRLWWRICHHQVESWGWKTNVLFISVSRTPLPCAVYCPVSQNSQFRQFPPVF